MRGSGLLNVNLADQVAMLGGALFVFGAIQARRWPQWRVPIINIGMIIVTLLLAGSLFLGAYRFGWTDWARINRFAGWFILLAFAATGAFATLSGGNEALKTLVLSYVGACVGVVIVELTLIVLGAAGFSVADYLPNISAISGFAQNRNFFAFQLLIAVVGAAICLRPGSVRPAVLGLLFVGLWFCGARSGWIALVCVVLAALLIRALRLSEIILGALEAAAAVSVILIVSASLTVSGSDPVFEMNVIPTGASTNERLLTLKEGWKLFAEYPFFGAGLGAFRNLNILSTGGIPLVVHSTALWLLAELGIVGCLAFAVPAVMVWYRSWREARNDTSLALVFLCFMVMVVMSGPADMLYQRTFWLIVGAALAKPLQALVLPADQPVESSARLA